MDKLFEISKGDVPMLIVVAIASAALVFFIDYIFAKKYHKDTMVLLTAKNAKTGDIYHRLDYIEKGFRRPEGLFQHIVKILSEMEAECGCNLAITRLNTYKNEK